jgi:hypothetical protein
MALCSLPVPCFEQRILSAAGSLVGALGLALCGVGILVDTEWLLYVGGLLNGFGMGTTYVCFIKAFKTVWAFTPGFAAGWVMMISSAGSFVFVWICQALLDYFASASSGGGGGGGATPGDPSPPAYTFLILAAILMGMQFVGSFLLLPPPPPPPSGALANPLIDAHESADTAAGAEGAAAAVLADTKLAPQAVASSSASSGGGSNGGVMTTVAVLLSVKF